jgi:DNA mismatch endonuclease, patch repair protein
MTDHVTPTTRSKIMKAVGTKDTGAEIAVRRLLHSKGYRYRLHVQDLPGSPDLVFSSLRKVLFIHGCFWHGHDCDKGRLPKSKLDYWRPKIEANKERDLRSISSLMELGWHAGVVWQCELRDVDCLLGRLDRFLTGTSLFPVDKQ